MKILVDTSVWVSYLRSQSTHSANVLTQHLLDTTTQILVADVVLLELLQGFRPGHHLDLAEAVISSLTVVETVGESRARLAASRYRLLRSKGITVRKSIDVLIASYCVDEDVPLLFEDRDFVPFVDHLGLKRA